MTVKPGSKYDNLVPYAAHSFESDHFDKVIWWSEHGAVAKTVAFAEQFKRIWCKNRGSVDDNSSNTNEPRTLSQINRIYFQQYECSVANTELICTVEKAAIAILFSKVPIPGQDCEAPLEYRDDVFENIPGMQIMEPDQFILPSSRRRLKRISKHKRINFVAPCQYQQKSESSQSTSVSDTTLTPVASQSSRLVSSLAKVSRALSGKRRKKKLALKTP